jgi:energy-coupling factor transporter transmembrane protein EcfT
MTAVRRVLVAIGAITIGYAVLSTFTDPDVKLLGVLIFLAAVLVLHDGILLPITIGVGVLFGRLPLPARVPVRVAALISLPITIVALPLVLGYGRSPDNPSILPLHYGRGLLVTLAVIWVPTVVITAIRLRRHRRTGISEEISQ